MKTRTITAFLAMAALAVMTALAIPADAAGNGLGGLGALPSDPAKVKVVASTSPTIQTSPLDLTLIDVGTVKDVPRETVIMLDDGAVYRLENIRVPVNYFPVVKEYLKKTLIGKKVGIYANEDGYAKQYDQGGNKVGHVVTVDGVWVQADLVQKGMVWATSGITNRDLIQPLYNYEDKARRQNLGLWSDSQYTLKNSKTIQNTYNTFQVFQDVAKSDRMTSMYIFINFGSNYKKDFTISLRRTVCLAFRHSAKLGIEPKTWIGYPIRIRGWVERHNGPMIQLTYPEQLEYVDPDMPGYAKGMMYNK